MPFYCLFSCLHETGWQETSANYQLRLSLHRQNDAAFF